MANDLFKWEDRYQLKVAAMDDEHKQLIAYMNDLYNKYEAKAPVSEQLSAFKKLAEFTVKHFTDEEAYMAQINFPGLDTHKVIHKSLLSRVGEFAGEFEKNQAAPPELFNFLKTWLAAHIMGIDAKYASHSGQKSA